MNMKTNGIYIVATQVSETVLALLLALRYDFHRRKLVQTFPVVSIQVSSSWTEPERRHLPTDRVYFSVVSIVTTTISTAKVCAKVTKLISLLRVHSGTSA